MLDLNDAPQSKSTGDYRLPRNVKPDRYEIRLVPDLKAFTFSGDVKIEIEINEATREILLNALELEVGSASVERDGKSHSARIELLPERERLRLSFDRELQPGPATLTIAFSGILNDKLHGFYRSRYTDSAGTEHLIASTQFEATDARRAFPCWDEPELKARFKVTLVVDRNLNAISNGGQESERGVDGGKKEVVFRETIPMSTYLVAFIVGEFEATEPVDAGTPLRVVHVPGKGGLTHWAQEIGVFSLKFYADYYGLPYPADKLDLIAIPDFASGAMENLGAITFRETALLADEQRASRAELERVADVVSHENAHMWFGDLVTMKWWNGIWLNEAFATFMEMLAVDEWKPRWKRWESFSVGRAAAMAIDGLKSTRPIEFTVESPEDARAMFDILTYQKGAAVLRMLEQYLGAEQFRAGISLYLRKHEYANAETGDLWDALEESAGQPVRRIMDSWIFQPGFPLIEAERLPDGRGLKLRQHRFFYLPDAEASDQSWQVPVMVRARTSEGLLTRKLLMEGGEATLELPGALSWALLNEGGHGFYRVRYAADLLGPLAHHLGELEPIERFGLLNDTWAATVAGLSRLPEFIRMARRFSGESDLNVWRALLGTFRYLEMIAAEGDRPALATLVREVVGPAAARLGWEPRAGDSELDGQLRATLLSTLGTLGEDPAIREHAAALYLQFERDPASVDRDLAPALVSILADSGGVTRYDEFARKFKTARTPQEEQRYLFALADFRELPLLRRTMEMTLDGRVRTQNAPFLMHALMLNTACRYEAWDFLRRNWDAMTAKYPDSALPRMCEAIVALVDRAEEVKDFFASHRMRLGGKLIDQHLERLTVAINFKQREGSTLSASLATV